MAASNPRLWASEKTMRRLDHVGERAPVAAEAVGEDEDELRRFALGDPARDETGLAPPLLELHRFGPARVAPGRGEILARERPASAEIEPDVAYTLDLNFRLVLSQLPRPFQIGVAGQRDWTVSSQVKDRLRLTTPASPSTEGAK